MWRTFLEVSIPWTIYIWILHTHTNIRFRIFIVRCNDISIDENLFFEITRSSLVVSSPSENRSCHKNIEKEEEGVFCYIYPELKMLAQKKKKLYYIVHFIESDINKKKCIDCVPSKWISSDKETRQIMTKFMPPPYTAKRCTTLHTAVKNNENARSKWPDYPVKLLGNADTYLETLSKIDKFKHENYVCTTDYSTDIEENEHIKKNGQEKAKKDNYIAPIYDLSGKLSKQQIYSSCEEQASTDEYSKTDQFSICDLMPKHKKKSNIQKKESSSKNFKAKLPANVSISTHPDPDEVVENIESSVPHTSSNVMIMNYLKRILADIQELKYDQKLFQNDFKTWKNQFDQYIAKQNITNQRICTHWTEENNITWPLKTKEDYDKLNELLYDQETRKDFMATIDFIIDSTTPISKNLLAVIRKFLHKDLATKFNCVKQTKDKFTLKPSPFYDCIIEVVMKKSVRGSLQEVISEKTLDKLIGVILTNSRDWEKGRPIKNIINNAKERETELVEEIEERVTEQFEEIEENMCDKYEEI